MRKTLSENYEDKVCFIFFWWRCQQNNNNKQSHKSSQNKNTDDPCLSFVQWFAWDASTSIDFRISRFDTLLGFVQICTIPIRSLLDSIGRSGQDRSCGQLAGHIWSVSACSVDQFLKDEDDSRWCNIDFWILYHAHYHISWYNSYWKYWNKYAVLRGARKCVNFKIFFGKKIKKKITGNGQNGGYRAPYILHC